MLQSDMQKTAGKRRRLCAGPYWDPVRVHIGHGVVPECGAAWQPREGPRWALPAGSHQVTGRRHRRRMVAAVGFTREGGHPPQSSAWYTPGHPSPCAWRLPGHLVCSLKYLVYLSSYEASLYTALGKLYQSSKTPGMKLYY